MVESSSFKGLWIIFIRYNFFISSLTIYYRDYITLAYIEYERMKTHSEEKVGR